MMYFEMLACLMILVCSLSPVVIESFDALSFKAAG